MLTEKQKFDAWRWLTNEALAGNTNAVAVMVDWKGPDEDEEDRPLERLATTFQWWIDDYDRRPREPQNVGVTPPVLPLVRAFEAWIADIEEAASKHPGTEYAADLAQIARCLQMLLRENSLTGSVVKPPVWPTRPVLQAWIRALMRRPRSSEC